MIFFKIIFLIFVSSLIFFHFIKKSNINNQKLINDYISNNIENINYLRSSNEEKFFDIFYRHKFKGYQKETIKATNAIEAEALFCKENNIPTLRVISVKVKK